MAHPSKTLAVVVAAAWTCLHASAASAAPAAAHQPRAARGWQLASVLPHTPMHGLHGIVVGPDGDLYSASLTGRALYRIEPRTGRVRDAVAPPDGAADDLAFGADGTLAWTGGSDGQTLRARRPDGRTLTLATRTAGLNAVRFAPDGRLFFTRVFGGDGLYEADLAQPGTVRTVREQLGGLNAFDFLPDGTIVGPLFMAGTVAAVSPVDGSARVLASGYEAPCAVRRAPDGTLYVLEYRSGALSRLDAASGRRTPVATLPAPADNFALRGADRAYVTSTAWNGVTEVDLRNGRQRRVSWSGLSAPGQLAFAQLEGRETLLVADQWGPRRVDPARRETALLPLGVAGSGTMAILPLGKEWLLLKGGLARGAVRVDAASGAISGTVAGLAQPLGAARVGDDVVIADHGANRLMRLTEVDPLHPLPLAVPVEGPVGIVADGDGGVFVSEYRAGRVLHVAAAALNAVATTIGPPADVAPTSRTAATTTTAATATSAATIAPAAAGTSLVARAHDDARGPAVPLVTVVATGLDRPEGLARARDGRLLVAETGARRLLALPRVGGAAETLASHLPIGFQPGGQPDDPFLPTGVAVDAAGAIWIACDLDNSLLRLTRRDGDRR